MLPEWMDRRCLKFNLKLIKFEKYVRGQINDIPNHYTVHHLVQCAKHTHPFQSNDAYMRDKYDKWKICQN